MNRRRPRSGPSVDMRWVFEQPIGPNETLVLAALNVHGWPCYPTIEKLVAMTKLGRRTVQRALACMRQRELIAVHWNGKANTYTLNVPDSVRRCGTGGRTSGARGAHQRRDRGATAARGSEASIEAFTEAGVRTLDERRATPVNEDPPGTQYVSFAEVLKARQAARADALPPAGPLSMLEALQRNNGAGVPLSAGDGSGPGGSDSQLAQARLKALRGGRLYA